MTDEATAPPSDAELQAENDKLRADLESSNAALRAKLAESQAAVGDTGHTDEDVRRLEHPEEFAHETTPTSDETHNVDEPTEQAEPSAV